MDKTCECNPDDDYNLDAGYRKKFEQGYNEALNDCIGLLRKWFWGTEKRALSCEAEIRKLVKK